MQKEQRNAKKPEVCIHERYIMSTLRVACPASKTPRGRFGIADGEPAMNNVEVFSSTAQLTLLGKITDGITRMEGFGSLRLCRALNIFEQSHVPCEYLILRVRASSCRRCTRSAHDRGDGHGGHTVEFDVVRSKKHFLVTISTSHLRRRFGLPGVVVLPRWATPSPVVIWVCRLRCHGAKSSRTQEQEGRPGGRRQSDGP